jgi:hypothetical protein
MDDSIVALFGIFVIFGLPILAFAFFRVLAHRERMAMIQNGIAPGPPSRGATPAQAFREPVPAQVTLAKGIRLACIGFALTLGLSFLGFHDGYWYPGPWLLGGLIPLFIGIAQVLTALISGATLGPNFTRPQGPAPHPSAFGPPPTSFGPGPTEPPPNPATFDGSYTYRPGSTEQLRPPSSPPERR